jgi:hypothetical protein
MLRLERFEAGRKHVRTLIDRMSIAAIYRKRTPVHIPTAGTSLERLECMS